MIKELSSGRLQRTRTSLQVATPETVHLLGAVYVEKVNVWTSFAAQGGTEPTSARNSAVQSLEALKVLRRLLVAGYEHPNREKEVQELWLISQEEVGTFYSLTLAAPNHMQGFEDIIAKHLLQLSKLHLQMAKDHPAAFILLPGGVSTVRSYWDIVSKLARSYGNTRNGNEDLDLPAEADDEQCLVEKLGLQGLLLMRACVKMAYNPAHTFKYQHPVDKDERKAAVEMIKTELLTDTFVGEIMEHVITGFFKFRASDLRDWEEEPEEWERREEEIGDAWDLSIRSCAEKLFLDLVINFKELLVPRLLQVFQTYAAMENPDLHMKESVYAALGLAAPCLEGSVDFNAFLKSNLVPEVQIRGSGYNILRRRIGIMLGQWVPVKPAELDRASIYQIFQHLLDPKDPVNDHVVQVTAGRQFKAILEPFEFHVEDFLPYSRVIIERLMRLAQRTKLQETLLAIHETIHLLVSRMETHIAPYADQILEALQALWARSSTNREFLIQQHVIGMLSALITSLGRESIRYHPVMLPLIRNSVEDDEAKEYLLDESLELWAMILMGTEAPASTELLDLAGCLFPILDQGTDAVRQALEIADCYFLLAPAAMITEPVCLRFLISFETLLGTTRPSRAGPLLNLVETLIRTPEAATGREEAYRVLAKCLVDSSFLQGILEGVKEAFDAREVTGPRHRSSSVFGVLETDYLSVLARLALGSPYLFLQSCSAATGESAERCMSWLLSEWFQHFDNIGDVNRKKLHCLALTRLLSIQPTPHWLLRHLQSYMTMWTDLVAELAEGAGERGGDWLFMSNEVTAEQSSVGATETADARRKLQLSQTDPIHTINIGPFVAEHLRGAIAGCGGDVRFQEDWLANVDREVVNAFRALKLL